MPSLVVDTHAFIWSIAEPSKLSEAALTALTEAAAQGDIVDVSTISMMELIYLVEKGRLPRAVLNRVRTAMADIESVVALHPVDSAVAEAVEMIPRDVVPDMPDRIIAATALSLKLPLITRDRKIRGSQIKPIW